MRQVEGKRLNVTLGPMGASSDNKIVLGGVDLTEYVTSIKVESDVSGLTQATIGILPGSSATVEALVASGEVVLIPGKTNAADAATWERHWKIKNAQD